MLVELRVGEPSLPGWHENIVRGLNQLPNISATISTPPSQQAGADIVLDLTAEPEAGSWTVQYDGVGGEQSAAAAVRAGRFPMVAVVDEAGTVRAQGRPGSEQSGVFDTALADVGIGTALLIIGAIAGRQFGTPAPDDGEAPTPPGLATRTIRAAVGTAARAAYRLLFRAPHWRVGWRRIDGSDVLSLGELPGGWADVPDDGYRFFADPFPFEHQGATYLFVEDFDHRVGKGVISVVTCGDEGPRGLPTPVLTHDVHLSYPFVLGHAGDVWMIPETSGARRIELYRARRFPWEWELHSVLVDDVEASDATAVEHDGRWWMMATVGFGGSLSDSLCLWSAPDLIGPWTAHKHNPVLVDIASARPAGRIEIRDGRLLRPVQDCRKGYGAALAIAEIIRMDDGGFAQRIIAHHSPGSNWPGRRLHTLNSAGGLEVVDGSRLSPRFVRSRPDGGRGPYLVQREDDLDLRGDEYSALYDRATASAFQSGIWLDNLYRGLAPARSASPCILTIRAAADASLVGVLPFVRRRRGPVRFIEYADLGVSDYALPVLDREHEALIRSDPTVPGQVRKALGGFDILLVERVLGDPSAVGGLIQGARSKEHPYGAHLASLDVDTATWRGTLDPSLTRRLDKYYKRLRPKGGTTFRVVENPDEVESLARTLQEFRAARFGEHGGLDLFQDPDCFTFYQSVVRDSLAAGGPAKLNVLEVGGRPAALALDLQERDRELYLIVGYDFKGLRNYSLGLLIVDQLAQDVISRGQRYLDLTVGDEPYKADFGAMRRPLFHIRVARTPIGQIAFTGREVYLAARRTAKRALIRWESWRRHRLARAADRAKNPATTKR